MLIRLVFAFLLIGCGQDFHYNNYYLNVTEYDINPNIVSPNGIRVDTSGFDIDLIELDSHFVHVERCLNDNFPNQIIPKDTYISAHCLYNTFPDKIYRESIIVKIAPDWTYSCDSSQQVFKCNIDPKLCEEKGLISTEECPCRCRGAIQNQNVIITTPNMYLLNNDLIRLHTGCNYIWVSGLQECFG